MRRITFRSGLRWKLSAAIALVSALVALALSLVVHNAARGTMWDSSREVQDERLQYASRIYHSTGQVPFGAKINDPELPRQLAKAVADGRRASYLVERPDGVPVVWAAEPLAGDRVLSLRTRFTDRYEVLRGLDRALLLGSMSVVLGSSLLGVLVGGQLSRRLRKAADAAGEVARGDTEVRVRDTIGGGRVRVRDETDELADAVDGMADALQARLEAERRVTADIAHELRTPVTGLLTAAELLPEGRPTELVRNRAQALRQLVEDVLEVARLDGARERAELQEVVLGEFVRRRVTAVAPEASVRVVASANPATVTTDPRRLERILGNLLANAARHGSPPVAVVVDGRRIRVRDHGPGFPEQLLADGLSRFRTGSSDRSTPGHGLGLTIADGQARVLGARLTFRNVGPDEPGETRESGATAAEPGAGTGAVAVLWLPESPPGGPVTG
ncbi:sensor histidine kinase [Streptomyces oceani]|uniref:histidine kinase n=1 Tax=Streptomyces oceani TaxID=1075402 RepID=A0A1E7JV92_9ACTN|nr:HAMP domain-containing sensor histidine kinase [Streptomyces oceani]OEU94380.1 histidine kinase [Streptomyces oceani]